MIINQISFYKKKININIGKKLLFLKYFFINIVKINIFLFIYSSLKSNMISNFFYDYFRIQYENYNLSI